MQESTRAGAGPIPKGFYPPNILRHHGRCSASSCSDSRRRFALSTSNSAWSRSRSSRRLLSARSVSSRRPRSSPVSSLAAREKRGAYLAARRRLERILTPLRVHLIAAPGAAPGAHEPRSAVSSSAPSRSVLPRALRPGASTGYAARISSAPTGRECGPPETACSGPLPRMGSIAESFFCARTFAVCFFLGRRPDALRCTVSNKTTHHTAVSGKQASREGIDLGSCVSKRHPGILLEDVKRAVSRSAPKPNFKPQARVLRWAFAEGRLGVRGRYRGRPYLPLGYPACHHAKLRTTNMLERLFIGVKRRTRVVGLFPNEASASTWRQQWC
jgi:Transposase, Mutator family